MFVLTIVSSVLGIFVVGGSILCVEAIIILDRVLEEVSD